MSPRADGTAGSPSSSHQLPSADANHAAMNGADSNEDSAAKRLALQGREQLTQNGSSGSADQSAAIVSGDGGSTAVAVSVSANAPAEGLESSALHTPNQRRGLRRRSASTASPALVAPSTIGSSAEPTVDSPSSSSGGRSRKGKGKAATSVEMSGRIRSHPHPAQSYRGQRSTVSGDAADEQDEDEHDEAVAVADDDDSTTDDNDTPVVTASQAGASPSLDDDEAVPRQRKPYSLIRYLKMGEDPSFADMMIINPKCRRSCYYINIPAFHRFLTHPDATKILNWNAKRSAGSVASVRRVLQMYGWEQIRPKSKDGWCHYHHKNDLVMYEVFQMMKNGIPRETLRQMSREDVYRRDSTLKAMAEETASPRNLEGVPIHNPPTEPIDGQTMEEMTARREQVRQVIKEMRHIPQNLVGIRKRQMKALKSTGADSPHSVSAPATSPSPALISPQVGGFSAGVVQPPPNAYLSPTALPASMHHPQSQDNFNSDRSPVMPKVEGESAAGGGSGGSGGYRAMLVLMQLPVAVSTSPRGNIINYVPLHPVSMKPLAETQGVWRLDQFGNSADGTSRTQRRSYLHTLELLKPAITASGLQPPHPIPPVFGARGASLASGQTANAVGKAPPERMEDQDSGGGDEEDGGGGQEVERGSEVNAGGSDGPSTGSGGGGSSNSAAVHGANKADA